MKNTPNLFSYRKYWAKRFGIAPVLPMSRAEMEQLGWDSCDIIIVTGDAYVDHPSFGMALIGRLLEAQGFRVGIISQPDWHSAAAFQTLGKPNLFFGVTAGNMDSMVNHYTAERKIRSDDAYTPNSSANKRPDRATIVYAQRCREAYTDVPIVIGGIEASLRRTAHYDYWSDKVRRSILADSKADILLYGNAERAIVACAHRLAKGESISDINDLRGTAFLRPKNTANDQNYLRLPSFAQVKDNLVLYAQASRLLHLETNPGNAKTLVQAHGDRDLWLNPPPIPLSTKELDGIYDLPYSRRPHPSYGAKKIPAYEMIRFSVNIARGCFGGCTFCSITVHEGRIMQNRSAKSILHEIEEIRDNTPGFTGNISDLGGPTANMYNLKCRDPEIEAKCRRLSCIYPTICNNMNTDHSALINLYRQARQLHGIKKILIGSGVRFDLAVKSAEYIKELTSHHVGGYLKIAPEHICPGPLAKMLKPGIESYYKFKELFNKFSAEVNKEQYLIPYFIAAHPGTTDEDMLELALWLKANNFRLDKVQNFLPTPMTLATTMYYTAKNPLHKITATSEQVFIPKKTKIRKLHKAFIRYHDPHNWPLLRATLKRMGREDLIGNGKRHLVPAWQPARKDIKSSKQ
jgi:uncharacterized radical SAM protein YgiQ